MPDGSSLTLGAIERAFLEEGFVCTGEVATEDLEGPARAVSHLLRRL